MPTAVELALLVLTALMMGVLVHVWWKLRNAHRMLYVVREAAIATHCEVALLYAQAEALIALHVALRPSRPLPPMRGWAASPDFLVKVTREILETRPECVVECGSGTSTVAIARALQLNGVGHLYSLEHERAYARSTERLLQEHGLSDFVTVLDAPLEPCAAAANAPWYSMDAVGMIPGGVTFLVVDGPPTSVGPCARAPVLAALRNHLAEGCVLYLDDAARIEEEAALARWLEQGLVREYKRAPTEKGCVRVVISTAGTSECQIY